jgi:hypothetical protein
LTDTPDGWKENVAGWECRFRASGDFEEETNWQIATALEDTSKGAKAADVLAQRKADAAKTTLPPIAEKTSKLMKINENLIRRQTEAAKVAAVEREKKKTQSAVPLVTLEKKVVSKRKNPGGGERVKQSVSETSRQATTKPQLKKQKVD